MEWPANRKLSQQLVGKNARCSRVPAVATGFRPVIEHTGILGSVCDRIPVEVPHAVGILGELRRSAEVPAKIRSIERRVNLLPRSLTLVSGRDPFLISPNCSTFNKSARPPTPELPGTFGAQRWHALPFFWLPKFVPVKCSSSGIGSSLREFSSSGVVIVLQRERFRRRLLAASWADPSTSTLNLADRSYPFLNPALP